MTASLLPVIKARFFDANNNPLSSGKVYTYQAGSSVFQDTYKDFGMTSVNDNPIILNAEGECDCWVPDGVPYKIVVEASNGDPRITTDNVIAGGSGSGESLGKVFVSGTDPIANFLSSKIVDGDNCTLDIITDPTGDYIQVNVVLDGKVLASSNDTSPDFLNSKIIAQDDTIIITDNIDSIGISVDLNELPEGPQGPVGPQGPQGVQGEKGDKGDTGEFDGAISQFNMAGFTSVAPLASTVVNFQTEVYDPDGVFANNEFTALNGGTYRFNARTEISAGSINTAGSYEFDIVVYKRLSGTSTFVWNQRISRLDVVGTSGIITEGVNIADGSFDIQLGAGDSIQLQLAAGNNADSITVSSKFYGSAIESVMTSGAAGAGGSQTTIQYNKADLVEGDLAFTYNDITKNVNLTGDMTANAYIGDGSQLTGISSDLTSNDDSIIITDNVTSKDLSYKYNQDVLNSLSGTTREVPTMGIIKDGALWYVDVEATGGGDIEVFIDGMDHVLDCTTGTGAGGKARSPALTLGTESQPFPNYVWVELEAGVPVLKIGPDVSQVDPVAIFGIFTLQDDALTTQYGALYYQRTNDASSHAPQFRGLVSEIAERVRILGPQIFVGCASTAVLSGTGLTSVGVSIGAGIVYQLHRQNVPAYPVPNTYIVVNDPVTAFKRISDLNEITTDALGNPLFNNNGYWGLDLGISVSSENMGLKIYVSLPSGSYNTLNATRNAERAISDPLSYGGFNLPLEQLGGLVRLSRIVLGYSNSGGGTIVNAFTDQSAMQDRRNWSVGSAGGGGGSSSTAAGQDTEVQINTGGVFGAYSAFTFDGTALTVPDLVATGSGTFSSVIKSGGTSLEFLKADGSVDSNTYMLSTGGGNSEFGVSHIGTWVGDGNYSRVGHKNFNTSSNYGMIQNGVSGEVIIKAPKITLSATTEVGGNVTTTNSFYTGSGSQDGYYPSPFTPMRLFTRSSGLEIKKSDGTLLVSVSESGDITATKFIGSQVAGTQTVTSSTTITNSSIGQVVIDNSSSSVVARLPLASANIGRRLTFVTKRYSTGPIHYVGVTSNDRIIVSGLQYTSESMNSTQGKVAEFIANQLGWVKL